MALAIEGGAMRGTISAGMALALDELGLVNAFDAVYGASAGAITGAPSPVSPSAAPRPVTPSAAPRPLTPSAAPPPGASWVFSIRPPAETPEVSRLATDGRLLRAAFEAGRAATHAVLKKDQDAQLLAACHL